MLADLILDKNMSAKESSRKVNFKVEQPSHLTARIRNRSHFSWAVDTSRSPMPDSEPMLELPGKTPSWFLFSDRSPTIRKSDPSCVSWSLRSAPRRSRSKRPSPTASLPSLAPSRRRPPTSSPTSSTRSSALASPTAKGEEPHTVGQTLISC